MTNREYDQKYSEQGQYDASHGRSWNGPSQDPDHSYNVAYYTELGRQHGYKNIYNSAFGNYKYYQRGYDIGKSERQYGHA